jgi:uncharacterized coiled-coil DUF342 family protein
MDTLKLILDYIVIPLIVWLYKIDKNQTILETKIETIMDFRKEIKIDVTKLFDKLDDIKKEIHSLTSNYVLKQDCTDCKPRRN